METDKIKKELGLRIKSFRVSKKYSQEQFCSIIGLEQPNLSNIENGKSFPDILTLCTIIEKAHVEPHFLFEFLIKDSLNYKTVDYEILEILQNISEESKQDIKKVLTLIKR